MNQNEKIMRIEAFIKAYPNGKQLYATSPIVNTLINVYAMRDIKEPHFEIIAPIVDIMITQAEQLQKYIERFGDLPE